MGLLSKIFGKETVEERKGEPDLIYVPNEDEKMAWAIEKAGLTLWYFIDSLKNPLPEQSYFSIKVKIVDKEEVEHIWLNAPDFDEDGNLYGIVGNEPVNVSTVKLGQNIGVDKSLISDWMIIEDGTLTGGYTIRAIRDGIPENEQPAFDDSIGIYIDEGNDHFGLNFNTPEGAILCLEEAFNENDVNKAISCKDFYEEARLMLSKIEFEVDEDVARNTADVLEASFVQYLEQDGMPDFTGLKRAFTNREKVDDNYWIITEVCTYPDGGTSKQRLDTYKTADGWRVLGLTS